MLHRLGVGNRKRALHHAVRGVIVAALIVAGIERGTLGIVLAIVASVVLVAVVLLEMKRSQSTFERMRKRLKHAQQWSAPAVVGTSEDWDPSADDRVAGLWSGRQVQVASTSAGVQIAMPLGRWPSGLVAERRRGPGGIATGDDNFDRVVLLMDEHELWRCTLGPEPRRLLLAIGALASASVHERTLEILLDDVEVEKLERLLDLAAELASALREPPDEPMARVFELALAEPVSGVRAGQYRWLVERGWDTPRVLRAAAADPDPDISAWGASQLAPTDGVFR